LFRFACAYEDIGIDYIVLKMKLEMLLNSFMIAKISQLTNSFWKVEGLNWNLSKWSNICT